MLKEGIYSQIYRRFVKAVIAIALVMIVGTFG